MFTASNRQSCEMLVSSKNACLTKTVRHHRHEGGVIRFTLDELMLGSEDLAADRSGTSPVRVDLHSERSLYANKWRLARNAPGGVPAYNATLGSQSVWRLWNAALRLTCTPWTAKTVGETTRLPRLITLRPSHALCSICCDVLGDPGSFALGSADLLEDATIPVRNIVCCMCLQQ